MASQVFPMQGNPRQIFVPYNGKIADITHADTNLHTLELANAAGTGAIAGETRKIIALFPYMLRAAGTGNVRVYPNEGTQWLDLAGYVARGFCVIGANLQRVQYSLSVAGDDFEFHCLGYVVEA